MARRVVTPRVTLAGTALWSIQKENQEIFVFIFLIILSIIYPGDILIISIFEIIIIIYSIIRKENQETKTIMVVGM